jgi:WD40 repeat protein
MADVFISYSRRDTEFVKVLYEALNASTYDTWIDWQGIAPTTEWWKEIEAGIESSDNFLFVISPDSVASKYCLQEIDHAVRHNKRIIPVLRQGADMPRAISHIQRVAFREEDPFDAAFAELVAAINTDQDHKKTHTRLELRAIEWEQKGNDESYLLRGSDLEAAEQWLIQSSSGKEPIPTDLQRTYVATSAAGRRAANNRQRVVSGVLGALLLLASVAGGLAFAQYRTAQTALNEREAALTREEDARRLAEQRLQEAETAREQAQTAQVGEAAQRQVAETKQQEAEEALTQAEAAQQAEAQQRQRAEQALVRAEEGEAEANRQAQIARVQTGIAEENAVAARRATVRTEQETQRAEIQALNAEIRADAQTVENLVANHLNFSAMIAALQLGQKIKSLDNEFPSSIRFAYLGNNSSKSLTNLQAYITPSTRFQAISTLREINYSSGFLLRNSIEAHMHWVMSVNISPDGENLVSTSRDGTVRLWNTEGQALEVFNIPTGIARQAEFSPDGQTIASANSNGTINLWDINGKRLKTLSGHNGEVRDVSFSPDGSLIASTSDDGTAKLWRRDGQEVKTLDGNVSDSTYPPGGMGSVSFSPDSQVIITTSVDGQIKLWDRTGEEIITFRNESGSAGKATFSPNGQMIAVTNNRGSIRLLDKTGKELLFLQDAHQGNSFDVGFSPDGQMLMSTGQDGTIKLWTLDGDNIQVLRGHSGMIFSASFSPNGNTIVSASTDGSIKIWERRNLDLKTIRLDGDSPVDIKFSLDSEQLFLRSLSEDDRILRIFGRDGRELNSVFMNQEFCQGESRICGEERKSFDISPNGRDIVFSTLDGSMRLVRFPNNLSRISSENLASDSLNPEVISFSGHSRRIDIVSFSPSGETIVSGGRDGKVRIWDLQANEVFALEKNTQYPGQDIASFFNLDISFNGQMVAFSDAEEIVKIVDILGNNLADFANSRGKFASDIAHIVFSPNSKMLAFAYSDGSIRIGNIEGVEVSVSEGHLDSVSGLSFSHDSEMLASASWDGTVKVWDLSGNELQTLEGHSAPILDVSFSPDGQTLASVGMDGQIILWNFDLDDLIAKSCDWLRDYMTNPATPEDERALCAEELGLPLNTAVPSRVNWLANLQGFWRGLLSQAHQDFSLVPRQLADQS